MRSLVDRLAICLQSAAEAMAEHERIATEDKIGRQAFHRDMLAMLDERRRDPLSPPEDPRDDPDSLLSQARSMRRLAASLDASANLMEVVEQAQEILSQLEHTLPGDAGLQQIAAALRCVRSPAPPPPEEAAREQRETLQTMIDEARANALGATEISEAEAEENAAALWGQAWEMASRHQSVLQGIVERQAGRQGAWRKTQLEAISRALDTAREMAREADNEAHA